MRRFDRAGPTPTIGTVAYGADNSRIWTPTNGLAEPLDDVVTFVTDDGTERYQHRGDSLHGVCPAHDKMDVPNLVVRQWIDDGLPTGQIYPTGWPTRPDYSLGA